VKFTRLLHALPKPAHRNLIDTLSLKKVIAHLAFKSPWVSWNTSQSFPRSFKRVLTMNRGVLAEEEFKSASRKGIEI
jgi:hypothetical protein